MSKITELGKAKKAIENLTKEMVNAYKGKDIKDICDTNFVDSRINHCAHFISHVIGLKIGMICGDMKFNTKGKGTSIRVNEIYNSCSSNGLWSDRPKSTTHCLIFATIDTNMKSKKMMEHPRKHIGIYINGVVWHYSNSGDKVVTDSAESFSTKFKGVYGKNTVTYFGTL